MFEMHGSEIVLTAGDTGVFIVNARPDGYIPTSDDRAIFTVRDRIGGRVFVEKTLTPDESGKVEIELKNEDTKRMRGGRYVWDIRYVIQATFDGSGNVNGGTQVVTPMQAASFFVEKAVGDV